MTTASREKLRAKSLVTIAQASKPVVGSYQDKEAELLQMQIGRYVAAQRVRLVLTQEQLAKKLGVSINSVWRWEAGYQITLPHLIRLARLLNLKPWEVLHRAALHWKDNHYAS